MTVLHFISKKLNSRLLMKSQGRKLGYVSTRQKHARLHHIEHVYANDTVTNDGPPQEDACINGYDDGYNKFCHVGKPQEGTDPADIGDCPIKG
jgi:hypothetical protein